MLSVLRQQSFYSEGLGFDIIDYYAWIKEAKLVRFRVNVADFEQRRYFDRF